MVNSWRNRLIGDRELPEDERLTRTNIAVTKSWTLEESGLLGPVWLAEQVTGKPLHRTPRAYILLQYSNRMLYGS